MEVISAVQLNNPQAFSRKPAFDGRKNFFSFSQLFPGGDEGVFSYRPEGAPYEYTITIRLVAEVESRYVLPLNQWCFSSDIDFSVVRGLISGSPSDAATNVSNILQVFISQHSNM